LSRTNRTIGVFWSSTKPSEKRIPIHFYHLEKLEESQFKNLWFEEGYPDLEKLGIKTNEKSRKELLGFCDILVIPKPSIIDIQSIKEGAILFGWMHLIQNIELTSEIIQKKATVISWENMFYDDTSKKIHVFERNNRLAGYAGLSHFMSLIGRLPGLYGETMSVAIIGYGNTAKGAIDYLVGNGVERIDIFSRRFLLNTTINNVEIEFKLYRQDGNDALYNDESISKELDRYDLIVNCSLQDPINPIVYIRECEITRKKLIVDISADQGMGFDFAVPTSFIDPIITSEKYTYYSVDHTPNHYYWAASFEISKSLFPYLSYMLDNDDFSSNLVIKNAMEIQKGNVLNPNILRFQSRETNYPHKVITKG